MAEETEEEFKARMAAISSGYKKERADRKVQLAKEGEALVYKSRTRYHDGIYGDFADAEIKISKILADEMFKKLKSTIEERYTDREEQFRSEMQFICTFADELNAINNDFPDRTTLESALSNGLSLSMPSIRIMKKISLDFLAYRYYHFDHDPVIQTEEIHISKIAKAFLDIMHNLPPLGPHPMYSVYMSLLTRVHRGEEVKYHPMYHEFRDHLHRMAYSKADRFRAMYGGRLEPMKGITVGQVVVDESSYAKFTPEEFTPPKVTYKMDDKEPWKRYQPKKGEPIQVKPVTGKPRKLQDK